MVTTNTMLGVSAVASPATQCEKDALACRLKCVIDAGPEAISKRLDQLDSEWSVGRVVKAGVGVSVLSGIALGILVHPSWFALAAIPGLFLAQYMFTRRSILGDMLHGMGMRSGAEIDAERVALRALRGDFQGLPTIVHVEDRDALSRMEDEGGPAVEPQSHKVDAHQAARELAQAVHQ
ncbi:MAG: hypothetical protein K2X38_06870 [Gemmataceae bacterium]|nr:hypothetical protein [Gemmataceae bacterium]